MPKTNIFQFKQFAIDQTGCAMKVNTDGVLLGVLATAKDPQTILDIGTGTGVIGLMLAQRFPGATIDAVEIDDKASETAKRNFENALFKNRCNCYSKSFQEYLVENPDKRYDLIVSNPPFFINSLKPAEKSKEIARHTTLDFFNDLFVHSKNTLSQNGRVSLILPVETADLVKIRATANDFYLLGEITIASFHDSLPHRVIISFGRDTSDVYSDSVIIYSKPKIYSDQYALLLKDFLIIF